MVIDSLLKLFGNQESYLRAVFKGVEDILYIQN